MKNKNDDQKEEAKRLRQKGFSIPEISRLCNISKSSALRYVKETKILPAYLKRWEERRNAGKILSERDKKIAADKAESLISAISQDTLAIMGASLYWAEGSKKDFSFCNSNPAMIKLFLYILRNVFSVSNDSIKVTLRIYEDLNKKSCLRFWTKETGIKLGNKTSVDILQGKKTGKLLYGMCRIRVKKGGLLLKEFSAIINRVNALTVDLLPS